MRGTKPTPPRTLSPLFPSAGEKGGRGLVVFTSEVIAKRANNGRFVAGSGTSSSPQSVKGEGRLRSR